ncbi:DUF721 domain-containing protein [Porphyromonas circumdentaria]|uniref:DUF721 domain-containing protein n=1 Tax=Porphyromonas circumdentaria TaxID=29524 RepID=A0A1T4PG16_9PORP|nr:DUF721 domain-containing protein [Porphyromonas circumdentaria]MBB6275713.1 hypothetical protein [Porphyromonas circumdentaria]MDO4722708.1 DUF721 domain-containing protein [Porphyromonas circumdentaria]SJZ90321.1 Protein of unknown function [Porphyromonas circumdentaria]
MQKKYPEKIGTLLKEWLEQEGIFAEGIYQDRALQLFRKRMVTIAGHIKESSCRGNILYVRMRSSAMAQMLRENKDYIIQSINEELNYIAIEDIRIFN